VRERDRPRRQGVGLLAVADGRDKPHRASGVCEVAHTATQQPHAVAPRPVPPLNAAEALSYAWDVDGNGTIDRQGRQVRHTYTRPGVYRARLTVTDARGRSGSATVPVVVLAAPVRAAAAATCAVPPAAHVAHGRLVKPAGASVKVTRRGRIRIVRTTSGGTAQRTAYVRRHGKLRELPAFEYRGCGALKALRLSGPTFKRALSITVTPRMRVEIVRRGKIVRTLHGSRTVRRLPRGAYRVRAGGVTLRTRRV
jgi:hypothetical protein